MTPLTSCTSKLAVVIVTFHPDVAVLRRQIASYPADALVVMVDNRSDDGEIKELRALTSQRPLTKLLLNASNLGLASALNKGVHHVASIEQHRELVLLMDQDCEPRSGSVNTLIEALQLLEQANLPVGCVGPLLIDDSTGLQHGFHCMRNGRWTRRYPEEGSTEPISCANLNGSGTLVPIKFFIDRGGLDESLFIDHVDTEWAFRVLAGGYLLFGIPSAVFHHRMGEGGIRFWWFGWRVWPQRAPIRHYFLFRNTTILWRRGYVPATWKAWSAVKLAMTIVIHAVTDSKRLEQMRCMFNGARDGLMSKAPKRNCLQMAAQQHVGEECDERGRK